MVLVLHGREVDDVDAIIVNEESVRQNRFYAKAAKIPDLSLFYVVNVVRAASVSDIVARGGLSMNFSVAELGGGGYPYPAATILLAVLMGGCLVGVGFRSQGAYLRH